MGHAEQKWGHGTQESRQQPGTRVVQSAPDAIEGQQQDQHVEHIDQRSDVSGHPKNPVQRDDRQRKERRIIPEIEAEYLKQALDIDVLQQLIEDQGRHQVFGAIPTHRELIGRQPQVGTDGVKHPEQNDQGESHPVTPPRCIVSLFTLFP